MTFLRSSVIVVALTGASFSIACSSGSDGGSSADASVSLCTPGQSVACVGAGGCQGGQACNAEGSGYGACTCGSPADGGSTDSSAGDSASDGGGGDAALGCTSYAASTISAMRKGASGCFSLTNVVSLAVTPSTTSPSIHVQDAAGGAFSAMRATCSSTSVTHPCTHAAAVAATADGHSVTVSGAYVRSASTHAESFYVESFVDNGPAATVPASANVTVDTIKRGSVAYDTAFQLVTVDVSDTLVMYDWTPAELTVVGASTCPYQLGFGMAPMSSALTATAACTSGTSQPAGQASPNAAEVLFATDFYKGFTVTSDCRCAKSAQATVPGINTRTTGSIRGLLVWSVPVGAATGFMYFAPKTNADAPLTNTVAGM